jgi:hypothetical protein
MQGPGTGVPPAAAADDDRSRRSCDDRRDTAERNIVLLLVVRYGFAMGVSREIWRGTLARGARGWVVGAGPSSDGDQFHHYLPWRGMEIPLRSIP